MKKLVRLVKAYDDVHLQAGKEVEAEHEVRITVDGGEALLLDLTAENLGVLRRDLKPWLQAARQEPVRRKYRRAAGEAGVPVCRNPAEGMPLKEAQEFLASLRQWAAAGGRAAEITKSPRGKYTYGQQLVDDYKAFLAGGSGLYSTAGP